MNIWKLRNKIAKKLNLPFLAGRHNRLLFTGKNEILLPGSEVNQDIINKRNNNKLIFLHIPKTAGSTVNAALEAQSLYHNKIYLKAPIRDYKPPILINKGWLGASNTLSNIKPEILDSADIISGHFPFGVHSLTNKTCSYFTIIRDPIEREISSFNYLYQTGEIEKTEIFSSFASHLLDNPQVRMLAGASYMDGVCNEETYNQALENLSNHFILFGPTEKTDEILNALIGIHKWPSIIHYQFNVSKKRLVNNIDKSVYEALLEKNRYDKKLHEFATQHWKEWKNLNIKSNRALSGNSKILVIDRDFFETKSFSISSYDKVL
ncbi:MAG: sulfotransferase family 2 domain-containing protein [Methylomonas sp.]|nr:sulfotransferase family 2 domain-containing protein [Methylomonas sp.]